MTTRAWASRSRRWTPAAPLARGLALTLSAGAIGSIGSASVERAWVVGVEGQPESPAASQGESAAPVRVDPARPDPLALARAIRAAGDWPEVARLATGVAARSDGAAADLAVVRALGDRLADAPSEARAPILRALALSGSRDAVAAIMPLLADPSASPLAQGALRDLTGLTELPDAQAWRDWWTRTEWIPEAEWLRRLARWQADRAGAMARQSASLERRLVDTARARFVQAPAEQRPALILESLQDDLVSMNRLGLEFASRAVLDATPLPPGVFDAAAGLLANPASDVRASAARLLASAGAVEHTGRLRSALTAERDPSAASAQMDALGLMGPAPADADAALPWLSREGARVAAARLLSVALREHAGAPGLDAVADRVLAHVGVDRGRSLGPAGVSLFGVVAQGEAWREGLLDTALGPDEAMSRAALEALVSRAEGLEAIVRACPSFPGLASLATVAASASAPTARAWAELASMPGVTDDERVALARSLPDDEALRAAAAEPLPGRRLLLLDRFRPAAGQNGAPPREDAAALRVRALFDAGRDTDALAEAAALDSAGLVSRFGFNPAVAAALCAGQSQTDGGPASAATARDWLAAIERMLKTAPEAVGDLIDRARVESPAWTDPERARLASLEADAEKRVEQP